MNDTLFPEKALCTGSMGLPPRRIIFFAWDVVTTSKHGIKAGMVIGFTVTLKMEPEVHPVRFLVPVTETTAFPLVCQSMVTWLVPCPAEIVPRDAGLTDQEKVHSGSAVV